MAITEISIIHHIAIVIFLLWLLNAFNYGRPLFYFLSLVYMYQVNERYVMRLRRKLQFEERRNASQRRVLLESETVRWLNHAIEKIWPVCMEEIVSKRIFLPIIPWFLDKYKPWTIKKATIEQLYLGRKPPIFTELRVLRETSDDDHLVLELGLNFLTADDMSAILAAKLRKTLGFGMVAKMHITSMHVEGKVLVGVKFIHDWPYISRLRICFAEPPYFQMTVKPIFNHGVDVTEVPGIAGWLDNILAIAFEETLVEPNMLVVDMEKFVSPEPSSKPDWFSVSAKVPIAYARVEVIEGSDLKSSDRNGLADPYVKGKLGSYRFKTSVQRKTLTPKWQEEFKIPICSWESDIVLTIEVGDKDHFMDDNLGVCSVDVSQFKDGQRHDMWLPLENIKIGRLHLAITVIQADSKEAIEPTEDANLSGEDKAEPAESQIGEKGDGSLKFQDVFRPIDIEGVKETGMWVHHPGSDISQKTELRKGRSRRRSDTEIQREGESVASTPKAFSKQESEQNHSNGDEHEHEHGEKTSHHHNIFSRGMHRINSVFQRSHKAEDTSVSSREQVPSPRVNVNAVDAHDCLAENQDAKTATADAEGGQDENGSSLESTKAEPKSMTELKHLLLEEKAKDRGINDVDSESSDGYSVLNENSLEGLPIPSSEATNNGEEVQVRVDTRDPSTANVEANEEVASKTS